MDIIPMDIISSPSAGMDLSKGGREYDQDCHAPIDAQRPLVRAFHRLPPPSFGLLSAPLAIGGSLCFATPSRLTFLGLSCVHVMTMSGASLRFATLIASKPRSPPGSADDSVRY